MTGHFTSYKHRTNHELATLAQRCLTDHFPQEPNYAIL
jgi:hypothetical protein